MLNTLNVGPLFGLAAALAPPVGRYMARVYGGKAT